MSERKNEVCAFSYLRKRDIVYGIFDVERLGS